MSMNNYTSPSLFPNVESIMRKAWLQLFGSMVQEIRETAGRTLEEASQLAGMFSLEWAAIEAGYIPADPARLRLHGRRTWNPLRPVGVAGRPLPGGMAGLILALVLITV